MTDMKLIFSIKLLLLVYVSACAGKHDQDSAAVYDDAPSACYYYADLFRS